MSRQHEGRKTALRALGAESRRVVGMVLGRGMTLVAVGGLLGAVLAAFGAHVLSRAP